MHVGDFPAAAANSLIQGYCDDFISLAALLAQTLEQVSMREIDVSRSNEHLERIEQGMRDLADAIRDQVHSGRSQLSDSLLSGIELPSGSSSAAPPPSNDLSAYLASDDEQADASVDDGPSTTSASDEILDSSDQDRNSVEFSGRLRHGLPEDFAEELIDPRVAPQPPAAQQPPPTRPPAKPSRAEQPAAPTSQQSTSPPPVSPPPVSRAPVSPPPVSRAPEPAPAPASTPTTGRKRTIRPPSKIEPRVEPSPPAPGPEPTKSQRALKGTNHSMPVLSVFQFIERMRKSGVMTVSLSDEVLTFEFDNGCVQSCRSTNQDKGDRLGDLLIEDSACDAKKVRELLYRTKGKTKFQIGEMIVRSGCATNGQIMDALESQVRRRFARACQASKAVYEFADGTPEHTDGRIRIAPMELSFESSWSPDL